MARQQASGGVIGLVVLGVLWAGSMFGLVMLYTGQEKILQENADLRAAKDRLISPNQERSIELIRSASANGPTVVGILEEERSTSAMLATGDPADTAEVIRTKRDELLGRIASDDVVANGKSFADAPLVEGMKRLYEELKSIKAAQSETEAALATCSVEREKFVEKAATMVADFEAESAQLKQRIAQIEAERAQFRDERDQAVAQLERDFESRRQQNDAVLTSERADRLACEDRLALAQQRFRALQEKLGTLAVGPDQVASARKADGRILTAKPGDPVVYIDLGRDDSLVLGMRFEVFSGKAGIPASGPGKAIIEVVSMSQSSSECRLVAVGTNAVVLEGDLIANPIYDPNRKTQFVVLGEFDLDRDGLLDRDGAAAVGSLIEAWGGEVSPEITPLTDFLVLGMPPRRARPDDEVPPDQLELNRARRRARQAYDDTRETARSLSIPIMTQQVFLDFLGAGGNLARG